MKENNFTLSQMLRLGLLILFAVVGWVLAAYLYGFITGGDFQHKQIIEDYKQGVKRHSIKDKEIDEAAEAAAT